MSKANIKVHKCIQDVHDLLGDDSVMVSRVFFSVSYKGKVYNNLNVVVSHNFGIDYSSDPLEVHKILGLDINLNHSEFSGFIENYYRSLVGSNANGISFSSGMSGIRMSNNIFIREYIFDVNVTDSTSGGW